MLGSVASQGPGNHDIGTGTNSSSLVDNITTIMVNLKCASIQYVHYIQLHVLSVVITSKVVSSNPAHGKVYSNNI